MRRNVIASLTLVFIITLGVLAQERIDWEVVGRIKSEGFQNSQVMETLSTLTDVYGPRLTNSPNFRAAAEWSVKKLTEWGLVNAQLEPWGTFGRGWSMERVSVEMTEPQYMPIIAYPKAWTAGTNGVISGTPVQLDLSSEEEFEKHKGKLKGAIVMTQVAPAADTQFEPDARRHGEEDLKKLSEAPEPGARSPRGERMNQYRARRAFQEKLGTFLRDEGVVLTLEPSRGEHGMVFIGGGGSYKADAEPGIPALVVAVEHYGRIARLLQKKIPVKLEVNIQTRFHNDDVNATNVIAEIPGTDPRLKDEIVMLGGHLDSWHAGTGATDNAAGCAVAMEAVRILKATGLQPRRTIRIALWSAEEQGLLGSREYVKAHFADPRTMELKAEHGRISAYFNLDNGTGKIRGVYLQNNDAIRPIFEEFLRPFHDLGAKTLAIRNTGGTDHLAFDAVGIPGFQFIQDPIDYGTRTHHTNMDVYDRGIQSDLMQASVIMASFVYHTAMRDSRLPRKSLPKPQPERTQP